MPCLLDLLLLLYSAASRGKGTKAPDGVNTLRVWNLDGGCGLALGSEPEILIIYDASRGRGGTHSEMGSITVNVTRGTVGRHEAMLLGNKEKQSTRYLTASS